MRWHLKPQLAGNGEFFISNNKFMTKIYLVRHAESLANAQGIYQGQTYDTPLSNLGKKQAAALAKSLKGVHFDLVISSPLLRTRETAGYVTKKIELEPRLLETNHGDWEGKHKSKIEATWPQIYTQWFTAPKHVVFPRGEPFLKTQSRVLDWWSEIISNPINLLVVSHDNIIRIIVAEVLNIDLGNIWQFHLQTAAITVIEIQNNKPKVICLNDTSHLTDLQADLSLHAL